MSGNDELGDMLAEMNQLRAEIDKYRLALDAAKALEACVTKDRDQLRAELDAAKNGINGLHEQIADERSKHEAELAMRVSDLDSLTTRMCEATTELAAAKAERDEIRAERSELRAERRALNVRIDGYLAQIRCFGREVECIKASHAQEIETALEDAYRGGFNADHKYDCPYNYRIWKASKETTYEHISKNVLIEVDPTDVGAQLEKLEQKLLRVVGRTEWPEYAGSFSEMVCQLLWDTIAAAEERALEWSVKAALKYAACDWVPDAKAIADFLAAYRAKPAPEGEHKPWCHYDDCEEAHVPVVCTCERRKRQEEKWLTDDGRAQTLEWHNRRLAPFTYKGEGRPREHEKWCPLSVLDEGYEVDPPCSCERRIRNDKGSYEDRRGEDDYSDRIRGMGREAKAQEGQG